MVLCKINKILILLFHIEDEDTREKLIESNNQEIKQSKLEKIMDDIIKNRDNSSIFQKIRMNNKKLIQKIALTKI